MQLLPGASGSSRPGLAAEELPHLVGKACLLVSTTHPGLDAGVSSSATTATTATTATIAVRLKGSWSLMRLPPSGNATDASVPLIPSADSPSISDHHAGTVAGADGTTCNAVEGGAAGFLFLGGVLADGLEELAVSWSYHCNDHWGFLPNSPIRGAF